VYTYTTKLYGADIIISNDFILTVEVSTQFYPYIQLEIQ
jgi:hypothetical protein